MKLKSTKLLVFVSFAVFQMLVGNVDCQQRACTITKTYSCDEYQHSNYDVTVGKMGPRGPPGKDCDLTSVKEHLKVVEHKLNKTKRELTELKKQRGSRQPRDCYDIKKLDPLLPSGVYKIYPVFGDVDGFLAYCDQDTDGGGWTLFQRRLNGEQDFQQNWFAYANGFGNVSSEHWLGLEKLHQITNYGLFSLRVDLEDFEDNRVYAKYKYFSIGKRESYQLNFDKTTYEGTAGDSLGYHSGFSFSTQDRDQDTHDTLNCAVRYKGAFWHGACHYANLNALFLNGENRQHGSGIIWQTFEGNSYSLKISEMKIKPIYDY